MIDSEGSTYLIADIFGVRPEDVLPEVLDTLETLLGTIPIRQQFVLELRYGLKDGICRTLEGASPALGYISRERVRQLHDKALLKLRHPSCSRHLRPFVKPDAQEYSALTNRPYKRQLKRRKLEKQT